MNEQQLDLAFSALSDPTRRAILRRLAQSEATVLELCQPFGLSQPAISKHLRVLEEAGFITQGRDAQRRPRTLVLGGPLKGVDDWLGPFREQWERRFDRLGELLEKKPAVQAAKQRNKRSK